MNRFAAAPRLSFGRQPVAGPANPTTLSRASVRRTAQLHEAENVLPILPAPGEALHALITGRFDLMHLLVALLGKVGPARHLRIATLSYNGRNLQEMLGILDAPEPPSLTLLCSSFFRDHNKDLWQDTLEGFRERGQRAAATRTHAKVITIETAAGPFLTIEGSANLRSNSNQEQVAIIHDTGLAAWHSAWIDALVTKHEGENEESGEG